MASPSITRFRNVMSAGTLTGDDVYNGSGDKLGKVEDIMLDIANGKVAYVVLSFGGFMGMGDKLFAIPWQAFNLDQDNHRFILDVPKDKLENAPGFDKDNWPDMDSQSYGQQIYTYYGYRMM
jgi:sporulation protein YlmC with PRC-barrel domain